MYEITADLIIDTKELRCPLPLLKAKQALEGMQSGQILKVMATDPTTKSTFPAYLNRSGDELLRRDETDTEILYYIKKR